MWRMDEFFLPAESWVVSFLGKDPGVGLSVLVEQSWLWRESTGRVRCASFWALGLLLCLLPWQNERQEPPKIL